MGPAKTQHLDETGLLIYLPDLSYNGPVKPKIITLALQSK